MGIMTIKKIREYTKEIRAYDIMIGRGAYLSKNMIKVMEDYKERYYTNIGKPVTLETKIDTEVLAKREDGNWYKARIVSVCREGETPVYKVRYSDDGSLSDVQPTKFTLPDNAQYKRPIKRGWIGKISNEHKFGSILVPYAGNASLSKGYWTTYIKHKANLDEKKIPAEMARRDLRIIAKVLSELTTTFIELREKIDNEAKARKKEADDNKSASELMEELRAADAENSKGALGTITNVAKGAITIAAFAFAVALCPPIGVHMSVVAVAPALQTLCDTVVAGFDAVDAASDLKDKAKNVYRKVFPRSDGKHTKPAKQVDFLTELEKVLEENQFASLHIKVSSMESWEELRRIFARNDKLLRQVGIGIRTNTAWSILQVKTATKFCITSLQDENTTMKGEIKKLRGEMKSILENVVPLLPAMPAVGVTHTELLDKIRNVQAA